MEKPSMCVLTFFNSLFTSISKPGYHGKFIFGNVKLGNGFVCYSIKISVNWAAGCSDKTSPSNNRDTRRVRNDSQSAVSNFQCSAEDSSSLEDFFRITAKWSLVFMQNGINLSTPVFVCVCVWKRERGGYMSDAETLHATKRFCEHS